MSHFFNYDRSKHKHQFYTMKRKDGGFSVVVYRHDASNSSVSEQISQKYPELEEQKFATKKEAKQAGIDFFLKLTLN